MSIYVVKPSINGFYKIGFTKHTIPDKIQKYLYKRYRTAYGPQLKIMYIHSCTSIPDARNIEKRIFILLEKYKQGEIFNCTFDIIDDVLKQLDGRYIAEILEYKQKYIDEMYKNINYHKNKYNEYMEKYKKITGNNHGIKEILLSLHTRDSFDKIKEIYERNFIDDDFEESDEKSTQLTGINKYLFRLTTLKKDLKNVKISSIYDNYVEYCKNNVITDVKSKIALGMLFSSKIKLESCKKQGTSCYMIDRSKIKEYLDKI